ncbi:MAG TPA: cohesin domain-containing protein [Candidatus Saccharimonadales bacterium]|nr:cohesin domain-containing protein [Candidatus Saccharimonadales bacterium]
MSKTTIFLLIIFLVVMGCLTYVVYGNKQNQIIQSLTKPIISRVTPSQTSLSLSSSEPIATPGQTITVTVLIHNPNPHPSVAQFEISYDPQIVTIDSVTPGTFFTKPDVALQTIDPIVGRVSYALRCPTDESNTVPDCVNPASSTLATITLTLNLYALGSSTKLTFLPKTLIRTNSGHDLLKSTNDLTITITKSILPVASSSAYVTPVNKAFTLPTH